MRRAAFAACLALLVPGIARATDWSVEAGAALVNEPDHLGAKSRQWLVLPDIAATYGDRLKASTDDGARWTALAPGPLKLGPVIEYRTSYDRDLPRGFRKIRDAIEPGVFAELTTPVALIEGRVRKAVTGYRGWSAEGTVDTQLPIRVPGTIGLEARTAWADRAFARSRFGVDDRVAAANGLTPFTPRNYLTVGAGVEWRLPVAPRLTLIASAGADRLLTNGASPIVRTRDIVVTGLAFTYRFGRARP